MGSGTDQPVASTVIVTRDRPELLRRAIAAIEAQDVEGVVETIVVFDQSALDPSLERVGGPRPVRVVANTRTPGLPGGRNAGAVVARGDVLAFCDDDDEWLPSKLRQQLSLLDREPGVDVVVTGVSIAFEGRTIERRAAERISFHDFLRRRVMEANFVTAAVRRDAFWDRIGPADEDLPGGYGEDWEWMLRASRLQDVRAIPEPLARIHWHGSSFFSDRWATIDEALGRLTDRYPEFHSVPAGFARILGQRAFAQAGAGRRGQARATAWRSIRTRFVEPRGYLALIVASGLISADRVRLVLHRFGRSV
jgi:glycosyltransferase involved in cell wall biosynthesis